MGVIQLAVVSNIMKAPQLHFYPAFVENSFSVLVSFLAHEYSHLKLLRTDSGATQLCLFPSRFIDVPLRARAVNV